MAVSPLHQLHDSRMLTLQDLQYRAPKGCPGSALTPLDGCEVQPSSACDSFESSRTTAEKVTR